MPRMNNIGKTHTKIYEDISGYICVKYHATEVVRFNYDEIQLKDGGWRTATTKTRINQTSNVYRLGIHVYQSQGKWFVRYKDKTCEWIKPILVIIR